MKYYLALGIIFLLPFKAHSKGQISYTHLGRINEPLGENVGDTFIDIDVTERVENSRWDLVYDASVRQYTQENNSLYSVPELYVGRNIGVNQYALGRKRIQWSENNEFWALGELNPLKAFNLLEKTTEGIVGLHYERKTNNFHLQAYASALNIPQLNPQLTEKDGNIVGKNEWVNTPPTQVSFNNEPIPITYNLEYPKMSEILVQYSAGMRLAYESDGHSVYGYGGYRPENSLRINATGFYDQNNTGNAIVSAKPFVNHQYFWGSGVRANLYSDSNETLNLITNIEGVIPERGVDDSFEFQALKIQPQYQRLTYSTVSLTYQNPFLSVGLNGLYLIDGDTTNSNVFAKKPRWRRSVGATAELSISSAFSLSADYKYDLKLKDMALLSRMNYRLMKHLSFGAGVQIIHAPDDNSFWAPYRSNDSFMGNMTYIF